MARLLDQMEDCKLCMSQQASQDGTDGYEHSQSHKFWLQQSKNLKYAFLNGYEENYEYSEYEEGEEEESK